MAKNHARIAQRMDAMRADTGVDWMALLKEWREAKIIGSGVTKNAAQKVWERVCRSEAWRRYENAGSGVHVAEHSPKPLNPPPSPPEKEPEAETGEDAITRMLIQRRGDY